MKTKTITKSTVNQNVACAFYRVSTEKQENDRQIEDVRRYCQAYDYYLPEENEISEVISGAATLEKRKDLQKFLKLVSDVKPNIIVCSELSRLARSQDAVTIIKNWTDVCVRLATPCFLDGFTNSGRLFLD